jgi:16S rRNA (guanine527-N7)-methyltransferase
VPGPGNGAASRPSDQALLDVLNEARDLGFLGPGPLEPQVEHSRSFAELAPDPPGRAVDLGSGGGLPGLVLALAWPTSGWLLVEAGRRRAAFLTDAVGRLGLADRVEVRCQRAEETGRDGGVRAQCDLVVARSFGPPSVTAECAAPLLRRGGHLITAEPPRRDPSRWPVDALAELGLRPDLAVTEPWSFQRLVQEEPCPDRYPRRVGIPAKRPLYTSAAGVG